MDNSNKNAEPSLNRRARPAKPPLDREGIIAAAVAILENEGLSKVTMRRIAAALDTGAASLYVYVRNTEDLHAQILDSLLGPVARMATGNTWRERLASLVWGYTVVLFEHPEIARMTMSTYPSGANYLSLVDEMLGLLGEGGVPDRDASWAVDLLLAFATATAVEHGTAEPNAKGDDLSGLAVEIATIDARKYPHIARLGEELLSGAGPDRFHWGLDVLITGILSTPRAEKKT